MEETEIMHIGFIVCGETDIGMYGGIGVNGVSQISQGGICAVFDFPDYLVVSSFLRILMFPVAG